jgi:hypothetical protein
MGLILMFFILATVASAITESIAQLARKRASDLEKAIAAMLQGDKVEDSDIFLSDLKSTSVYKAASLATAGIWDKRAKPAYLSAKAFAEAITELHLKDDALLKKFPNLNQRVDTLIGQGQATITDVRAGLESWFDETMGRLEGAYKRWSTVCLFVVGLILSVGLNASTTSVAQDLWRDPVTRMAVVDSANSVAGENPDPETLNSIAETTDALAELSLPVGWNDEEWSSFKSGGWGSVVDAVGWLLTALFVMLGAPFWFDLLTKLASLRSSGTKPDLASVDKSSATSVLAGADPGQAQAAAGGAVGGIVRTPWRAPEE